MKYSTIILGYQRKESLRRIAIQALRQSVRPEQVIVLHNHPSDQVLPDVVNVHFSENYGCRIRHLFALTQLNRVDALLFVDDDVCMWAKEVVGVLLDGLKAHPDAVVGIHGRDIDIESQVPYSSMPDIKDGRADVVKGLLHAVRVPLIKHILDYDVTDRVGMEDDIILSASVEMATGEKGVIVPLPSKRWLELPHIQGGNQQRTDHYLRRDAACLHMLNLGWKRNLENGDG